MATNVFPTNKMLEEAVIQALQQLGGEAKVPDINAKVIEILQLPQEIVELEDDYGIGTKLSYRLRWARTNLKGKKIDNVVKGTWKLI